MSSEAAGPGPGPGGSASASRGRAVFSPDRASGQRERAAPARILIVEDDYLIAMQIEASLWEAGFSVTGIARSAEEAVEMAAAQQPMLAIMDIRLAGRRDGVDAALDIHRNQGIRCIFATAHNDQEVSRRAQPARPLGWLQKPYTMTTLIEQIERALQELDGEGN